MQKSYGIGDLLFLQSSSEVGLFLPIWQPRRTFAEIRTRDDFYSLFTVQKSTSNIYYLKGIKIRDIFFSAKFAMSIQLYSHKTMLENNHYQKGYGKSPLGGHYDPPT